MADTAYDMRQERGLKHLDLVRVAAVQAVLCMTTLYELAKDNSGPIKGGIQAVEKTVRSIMNPVYESFHDFPLEILFFADCKVDYALNKMGEFVPSTMKSLTCTSYKGAQNISAALREISSEIYSSGISNGLKTVYERYEPAALDLYKQYEPVAEHYAVATWQFLNCLPISRQVLHLAVPTAAYWAEKYNVILEYAIARDFMGARYLPQIPIEKIAKVFNGDVERENAANESTESESGDEVATSEPLDRSDTVYADVAESPDPASE